MSNKFTAQEFDSITKISKEFVAAINKVNKKNKTNRSITELSRAIALSEVISQTIKNENEDRNDITKSLILNILNDSIKKNLGMTLMELVNTFSDGFTGEDNK